MALPAWLACAPESKLGEGANAIHCSQPTARFLNHYATNEPTLDEQGYNFGNSGDASSGINLASWHRYYCRSGAITLVDWSVPQVGAARIV